MMAISHRQVKMATTISRSEAIAVAKIRTTDDASGARRNPNAVVAKRNPRKANADHDPGQSPRRRIASIVNDDRGRILPTRIESIAKNHRKSRAVDARNRLLRSTIICFAFNLKILLVNCLKSLQQYFAYFFSLGHECYL